MPVCPDCSLWTPDFTHGEADPWGTWYCNDCWERFEETERQQRVKSGRLLPEDRDLWYSDSVKPSKLWEHDQHIFNPSEEWLEVDTYSLVLEVIISASESVNTARICLEDDFILAGFGGKVEVGSSSSERICVPACSLTSLSFIWTPQSMVNPSVSSKKKEYALVRKEKRLRRLAEFRASEERETQKKRQQVQVEAKKKELLELAVKRANKKKADRLGVLRKKILFWKEKRFGEFVLKRPNLIPVIEPVKTSPVKKNISPRMPSPRMPSPRMPLTPVPSPPSVSPRQIASPPSSISPPPDSKRRRIETVREEGRRIARLGIPLRRSRSRERLHSPRNRR